VIRGKRIIDITVNSSTIDDKETLRNLMQLYIYDFTEFTEAAVQSDGLYNLVPDFNDYWLGNSTHYPMLIRYDQECAGFAMVKQVDRRNRTLHVIAQSFIMRKFRRRGLGQRVAERIFEQFKGEWEVYQLERNVPAYHFWTKTIHSYTGGDYHERKENGKTYQSFTTHGEETKG